MFISMLDKIVWILLVTVITTQALQFAGVVEAPTHGELQSHIHEFRLSIGNEDIRGKRQIADRSPVLDGIFNIPIATLNAVNDLVQNTRPALQRLRDAAVQRRIDAENAAAVASSTGGNRQQRAPLNAELSAGPRVQKDGSSSRVLLNV